MPSLGNDLALIRKEKNLSLDDIHATTKIPKHVINSIEDDSIFYDMSENTTYIRSYVRGYAKALSIDDQQIIYALDKQESDNYSGSLRQTEEGEKRTFEYDNEEEDKHDTDEQNIVDSKTGDEEDQKEKTPVQDLDTDFVPEHNITGNPQKAELSKPGDESPSVDSVDWANMGRKFQPLASTKSKVWGSIIVFLLIAAGGFFYYMYNSNSGDMASNQSNGESQQNLQPAATSDSLQLNISPSANEDTNMSNQNLATEELQNQALETLPDTLTMIIYAAGGNLEPVRVYTDIMDSINPYWIEEGEAVRFEFVNSINIRGQSSRMILLMNNHPIQNFREQFYNPDTRLLEINRSFFEGDSRWLQPAPDSLNIDAPPPTVIRERPTFN